VDNLTIWEVFLRLLQDSPVSNIPATLHIHSFITAPSAPKPPHYWGFEVKLTQHSIRVLWTNDRPVAETSTWQHTAFREERYIHVPSVIRTHSPSRRAAADPHLRPRGHRDRFYSSVTVYNICKSTVSLNNTLKIRVGILYLPIAHKYHDEVELQMLK